MRTITSTLIVTAEETACQQLEAVLKHHPDVLHIFQDIGNWYINGETGPEWFTVHIETRPDRKESMEILVKLELYKMEKYAQILFWSSS